MRVEIASINVDRAGRQRRELKPDALTELANSIVTIGLLQPIVIDRSGRLIAGERRLEAVKKLGWDHIEAHVLEDLPPAQRALIEWSENAHRSDLTWQERAAAITSYIRARKEEVPGLSQREMAAELGIGEETLRLSFVVSQAIVSRPELAEATSLLQANNAIRRTLTRQLAQALDEMFPRYDPMRELGMDEEDGGPEAALQVNLDPSASAFYDSITPSDVVAVLSPEASAATPASPTIVRATRWAIHQGSFLDWAPSYRGQPFNVLHCDFPYGINFTNTGIFAKSNRLEKFYSDEAADYWRLLACLGENWQRLVAPAGHIIFWFSHNYYEETKRFFETGTLPFSQGDETRQFMCSLPSDIVVDPVPLVWHKSDNKGMMHDANHKPRRIYESAFLITFGGQKLARPGSNVVAHPTMAALHPSAKPRFVVRQFLTMVCDTTTRLLDPTCGHGSAIVAACELGAKSAIGVELDPTHVSRARLETEMRVQELTEKTEGVL